MNTRRNIGSDGKLYSTTDNRDYGKYRVLNNDELRYELQQSVEITTAMLSTGRLADSRLKRPHSASRSISKSASFCAPMFGTASRSNKIEKRAWNKEASNIRGSAEYNTYSGTMSKLMANSAKSETSPDGIYDGRRNYTDNLGSKSSDDRIRVTNGNNISVAESNRRGADLDHIGQRGKNVNYQMRSQSPMIDSRGYNCDYNSDLEDNALKVNKTPLTSVMNALKLKYEQNLDVIGKLFDEKLSMEKLVQDLDHQLHTARKELASPRYAAAREENHVSSSLLAPSSSSSYFIEGDVDKRKNLNLSSGHRPDMDSIESFNSITADGSKDHKRNNVEEYARGASGSRGDERDRTVEPENQASKISTRTGYDDSDLLYPRHDREFDGNMMRDQLNSKSSADRVGHRGVAYHDYDHSESPTRGSYGSIDVQGRVNDRTHTQAPPFPSPSYHASTQLNEENGTAWDASTYRDRSNAGLSYNTHGTSPYRDQTASSSNGDSSRPRPRPTSATSTYSRDRGRGRDSMKESRWPIDGRRSMSRSLSFDTPRISAHLQADQDR